MRLFLQFLLVLVFYSAQAQEHKWNLYPGKEDSTEVQPVSGDKITAFDLDFNARQGEIKVNQDARIEKLLEFISTPQPGSPVVRIKGYRVQLFFDADKDMVNQKRADYLSRYNGHPAYVDYLQPNFRLRVGDFRTKLQAQRWQDEVKIEFPDAIIVEDWIELPELKITEE